MVHELSKFLSPLVLECPFLFWNIPFLFGSKRGSKKGKRCFKTGKDVLKQEKMFQNRKSYHSIEWGMWDGK